MSPLPLLALLLAPSAQAGWYDDAMEYIESGEMAEDYEAFADDAATWWAGVEADVASGRTWERLLESLGTSHDEVTKTMEDVVEDPEEAIGDAREYVESGELGEDTRHLAKPVVERLDRIAQELEEIAAAEDEAPAPAPAPAPPIEEAPEDAPEEEQAAVEGDEAGG